MVSIFLFWFIFPMNKKLFNAIILRFLLSFRCVLTRLATSQVVTLVLNDY